MENTFGLHCAVCPHADCRRLNPSRVGEPLPTVCHACGRSLSGEPPAGEIAAAPLDALEEQAPQAEQK
jgi:hypothetical protein